MPLRLPALVLTGLFLAGCTTAPDGSTSVGVTAGAVNFHIPGPSGCAGPVAEFQSVIDNDVATGNLAKGVHGRVTTDLAPIKAACGAGREADATRQLAAVKTRYGYH
jgi:hypothetical protein